MVKGMRYYGLFLGVSFSGTVLFAMGNTSSEPCSNETLTMLVEKMDKIERKFEKQADDLQKRIEFFEDKQKKMFDEKSALFENHVFEVKRKINKQLQEQRDEFQQAYEKEKELQKRVFSSKKDWLVASAKYMSEKIDGLEKEILKERMMRSLLSAYVYENGSFYESNTRYKFVFTVVPGSRIDGNDVMDLKNLSTECARMEEDSLYA